VINIPWSVIDILWGSV